MYWVFILVGRVVIALIGAVFSVVFGVGVVLAGLSALPLSPQGQEVLTSLFANITTDYVTGLLVFTVFHGIDLFRKTKGYFPGLPGHMPVFTRWFNDSHPWLTCNLCGVFAPGLWIVIVMSFLAWLIANRK